MDDRTTSGHFWRRLGPAVVLTVAATLSVLGTADTAGAAGSWTSRGPPFSLPGPVQGTFNAVSCATSTSCLAVGQATLAATNGAATIAGTTAVKKGNHLVTISADNGLAAVVTQTFTITCTH